MIYNRLNNITGWFIFFAATLVYVLTLEPTASYWDCGEFISCSYKLMIPHPPGAPFFLLVGRFFSMFTSDVTQVAYMTNLVSAVSSGFTSLFLFWSITMLAKKLIKYDTQPTLGQSITIMGAGIIGSMAYTFTDSAWFNAVESEVYAMSSFFTAFVFWAILKWESRSEEISSDKWIILIAYMMGLSIGVHLLNLLTVFALAFVVYFKKYSPSLAGTIATLALSAVIILGILEGIIPGLPTIAGVLEVKFVNSFGLPFGSGIIFFVVIILAALVFGIYYSIKNEKRILNTVLLCVSFILIGYSSYVIILIRTAYDPPIDMNDPGDVMSFVSYLKREQYGDRPLFKGPYFTAGYPKVKKGAPIYRKGKKKYEIYDYRREYIYNDKHVTLLPRLYSEQPHHIRAYRNWLNLPANKKPTMIDNLTFLFKYQIGHMYLRYFGWNFIGRKSDFQDAGILGPGDWFDKDIPYSIASNKARNNFFLLPLIAGLVGFFYHISRRRKDGLIVGLLFFFTGIAIVLYLNQPPVEPRERDYTFAGSFWAFSIWIGMAVLMLAEILEKVIKNAAVRGALATIICLIVPGILAAEGWNDHDRSGRYHSVDSAKNLLNSCAKNAILFTGGDNDTYPLWYAQEVEGFRRDVRVCNLSLLNTDWYISQMKRRAYESAPLPITLPLDQYLQGTNDQVLVMENENAVNLREFIKLIGLNDDRLKVPLQNGEELNAIPSKMLSLDIDKEKVLKSNIVPDKYKPFIIDKLVWNLTNADYVDKKTLIILDMIATSNWERPIYFSTTISPSEFLNLKEYTQLEGMAYRLLPVKLPGATDGWVDTDIMYNNMMTKFFWRNLNDPKVYYNEWYYSFTSSERLQFDVLAEELIKEEKKDKAKQVLSKALEIMPDKAIPYDEAVASYVPLLFKLGEKQKATQIINTMGPRLPKALEYADKINDLRELQSNLIIAQRFSEALREQGNDAEAKKYEELFSKYLEVYKKIRSEY